MRTPDPNPAVVHSRVHLPQLDGVRGIAILMVLACHFLHFQATRDEAIAHAFNAVTGAGYLGVDLFFVLSGFLITGILYDAKDTAHFFRYFYIRRALRIFPLYYTYVLAVCAALALFLAVRSHDSLVVRALSDGGWAAVYLTNVEVALKGSNVTFLFNAFWSLAIEEQFYLVWPLLVLRLDRRPLQIVCTLVVVSALVLRCGAQAIGWQAASNVLLPCRMDELALGAFVALSARDAAEWKVLRTMTGPVFLAVCAMVLVSWFVSRPVVHDNFVYETASFASAGLIVLVVGSNARTGILMVFRSRFLRFFGKYSYGLYVLNQPLAFVPGYAKLREVLTEHFHSRLASTVIFGGVGIGLSLVAAWLSWHLLEKRALRLKQHFEPERDLRLTPSALVS